MNKLLVLLCSCALACCLDSCKNSGSKTNLLVLRVNPVVADRTWVQDAYLKASNPGEDDLFGNQVAVSGFTMVVGVPDEDSSATGITNDDSSHSDTGIATDSGAVYVFKKVGKNWVQDAYLKASNTEEDDQFGSSVAVSGSTIVVGAQGEDSSATGITNDDNSHSDPGTASSSGAVYVFTKDASGNWVQDAYLKASNAGANDQFGRTVAVDGTTIVVGAFNEDSSATGVTNADGSHSDPGSVNDSGAVYVFKKDTSTGDWVQDAYLKASNAEGYDAFGSNVAVSGDTIAVSATGEDSSATGITNTDSSHSDPGTADHSGAVYVFKKVGEDWVQDAYIKASNVTDGVTVNPYFGDALAISGDTMAVGMMNERCSQTGITNSDGVASMDFTTSTWGAVYLFRRSASGNWVQDAYLKGSNADGSDSFGASVAVNGDMVVVGATSEQSDQTTITNDDGAASGRNELVTSGAAYVFRKDASGYWVQDAYLKSSNNEAHDVFGYSVAVDGSTIAVGAFREDSNEPGVINTDGSASAQNADAGYDSGAVYVFTVK